MRFETERLILRPWIESDAESLYEYASDPAVSGPTGFPVHKSAEESREVIKNILSADGNYAVCLKPEDKAVGCVSLMIGEKSNIKCAGNEAEIGYWIGVPFWGNGFIPEAVCRIMRYGFEELGLEKLWCGYFDGNEKSRRVQEKCGFVYHHTNRDLFWEKTGETKTEHITCITYNEWREQNKI